VLGKEAVEVALEVLLLAVPIELELFLPGAQLARERALLEAEVERQDLRRALLEPPGELERGTRGRGSACLRASARRSGDWENSLTK
jgi:hypothetical protein